FDKRDTELPKLGLIKIFDKESGKYIWVDSDDTNVRNTYNMWWKNQNSYLKEVFAKSGVVEALIRTDRDYIKPLVTMFKKRESRP
ncbi:MAG: DUF58 domain-containing protein, partial [Bacteroidota bacterium]|nr:DUF58 domain-containing protein [Bacteroidota bacterium]